MQLEATGRGGRVDALTQRYERNPGGLQIFQQENQVPEVAPEPIQAPHTNHIEPPALRVPHHLIERRAALLGSRDRGGRRV